MVLRFLVELFRDSFGFPLSGGFHSCSFQVQPKFNITIIVIEIYKIIAIEDERGYKYFLINFISLLGHFCANIRTKSTPTVPVAPISKMLHHEGVLQFFDLRHVASEQFCLHDPALTLLLRSELFQSYF